MCKMISLGSVIFMVEEVLSFLWLKSSFFMVEEETCGEKVDFGGGEINSSADLALQFFCSPTALSAL
jgi:hypothetical protein